MSVADNLLRMPGNACRFYSHGHCLLEEVQNPGYDASTMCSVLAKLEEDFEAFIDRADRFGMEELTAAMLWPRFDNRAMLEDQCPDFLLAPQKGQGRCLYQNENVCVLLLPRCSGRCSRFECASSPRNENMFHP